jgi:hypothetical protein
MDLPVDINTSVVDPESIAVLSSARRPIFYRIETETRTHSKADPLVIVYLNRAAGERTGDRGRQSSQERHGSHSDQKYFPSALLIDFHK